MQTIAFDSSGNIGISLEGKEAVDEIIMKNLGPGMVNLASNKHKELFVVSRERSRDGDK